MDEARDDVRIFEVAGALSQHDDPHPCRTIASQVIVPSEDVRRDRGCEVVPELILVSTCDADSAEQDRCVHRLHLPILDIHHPLRVCIAEIALVGQPKVDLGLVQGICDFIWKDACR